MNDLEINEQDPRVLQFTQSFEDLVILHPSYQEALTLGRRLLRRYEGNAKPKSAVIIGPTGVGKTTLARQLMREAANADGYERSVIHASLRGSTTLGQVYSQILAQLGDEHSARGSITSKLARLIAALQSRKVAVAFIDEVQHLLAGSRPSVYRLDGLANAFKSLSEQARTSLILAGTPAIEVLWKHDAQLRRRSVPLIAIGTFSAQDMRSWEPVTKALIVHCRKNGLAPPPMSPAEFAGRMMLATSGTIAHASTIVEEAGRFEISRGSSCLTIEGLRMAVQRYIDPLDGLRRAFDLTHLELDEYLAAQSSPSRVAPRTPSLGQLLSCSGGI